MSSPRILNNLFTKISVVDKKIASLITKELDEFVRQVIGDENITGISFGSTGQVPFSNSNGNDFNYGDLYIQDSGSVTQLSTLTNTLTLTSSIGVDINSSANVTIQGLTFPSSGGSNGQVLTDDGNGNLSFQTISITESQISDLQSYVTENIYTNDGVINESRQVSTQNLGNLIFNSYNTTSTNYTSRTRLINASNNIELDWFSGNGLGGIGSEFVAFSITNSETVYQDGRTIPEGIKYFDNYSATFTNRSLIDRQFAEGLITNLLISNNTWTGTNTFGEKVTLTGVDSGTDGFEIRNSAGEQIQMGFGSANADAGFSINYVGSGADDLVIQDNGNMLLGQNILTLSPLNTRSDFTGIVTVGNGSSEKLFVTPANNVTVEDANSGNTGFRIRNTANESVEMNFGNANTGSAFTINYVSSGGADFQIFSNGNLLLGKSGILSIEPDNNRTTINSTLNINNAYSFPISDGTANQVLSTDGTGQLSFQTIASGGFSVTNELNNRVITSSGTGTGNAEENLMFNSSTLTISSGLGTMSLTGGVGNFINTYSGTSTTNRAMFDIYQISNSDSAAGTPQAVKRTVFASTNTISPVQNRPILWELLNGNIELFNLSNDGGWTYGSATGGSGGLGVINAKGFEIDGVPLSTGGANIANWVANTGSWTVPSGTAVFGTDANSGVFFTSGGNVRLSYNSASIFWDFNDTSVQNINNLTINNDIISDVNSNGIGSVFGGATGGAQGAGTINATGLFVNGVAVGSGGSGFSVTNEANNRIITSSGTDTGNAEANLTWDGINFRKSRGGTVFSITSNTAGNSVGHDIYTQIASDTGTQPVTRIVARTTGFGSITTRDIFHIDNNNTNLFGIGVNGDLIIEDGITAPSASTGKAKIYVDSADGDLKIIFADGTIKTITTDTVV